MSPDPAPDNPVQVGMRVNGDEVAVDVPADEPLLVTLRERLGLTGPRGTCGIGVCGTCTVLVDGRVASSCILLTAQVEDRSVTTSEGLQTADARLGEVQEAFVRSGAYQCSFCIPGMTLAVQGALADHTISRDVASIREYLAGNLCRCGTYPEVLEAVASLVDSHPRGNEGK